MRPRRLAAPVAALLLSGAALAAWAPGPKQTNAIEKIAQVIAGAQICDDYVLNETLLAAIQVANRFSLRNPDVFAYVEARVLFHAERIEGRSRADICAAMERLYGPNGTDAPGLALKKN